MKTMVLPLAHLLKKVPAGKTCSGYHRAASRTLLTYGDNKLKEEGIL